MKRWLALPVVAAAVFAAAAVLPARVPVGVQSAYAKPCSAKFVHAVFPWGHRCIRGGQYCKKERNPEYHKYGFQCVNGKLRKETGQRKGQ
jgi:hypothetical protein